MMSCGPVTACAIETPFTLRILAATSRAFPGEVSIRMKALTTICVSLHRSRDSRAARLSKRRRRNRISLFVVSVETAAGLASEVARIDVLFQQRAGTVLVVTQPTMHHFHDREAGIESDQVGELERAHRLVGAELHRGVDIGHAADAFIERVDGLIDHRQQHAIDDEAGEVLRCHRTFAEAIGERLSRAICLFGSREAANDLDQLHRGNRIHEMHSDHFVGARSARAHPCDRDGRGVGGEDHIGVAKLVEVLKDRDLRVFIFHYRFDNEVGFLEQLDFGRGLDDLHHPIALFGLETTALDHAIEVLADPIEAALARLRRHIMHQYWNARLRSDLRDTGAHLARSNHPDSMNFHPHPPGLKRKTAPAWAALFDLRGRLVADTPSIMRRRAIHSLAHFHDVLGRLPTRHPEPAHESIGHLRGEPIANGRRRTYVRIEDAIDLVLGEPFGFEDIYQTLKSNLSRRGIDDLDDARAGHTDTAPKTSSRSTIDASHKRIRRLGVRPSALAYHDNPGPLKTKPSKQMKRTHAIARGPASFGTLHRSLGSRKPRLAANHPAGWVS